MAGDGKSEGLSMIQTGFIIVLVLAFLGVMLLIFNIGQKSVNSGTDEIAGQVSVARDSIYQNYDNTELQGSSVLAAIESFKGKDVGIIVATKGNTSGTNYLRKFTSEGYVDPVADAETGSMVTVKELAEDGSQNLNLKDTQDPTKGDYIKPGATFTSNLILNANDQIVGIEFKQK